MPYDPEADRDEDRQEEPTETWRSVYRTLFQKKLDDEDATDIEREIRHVFRDTLKDWEMTKAVRHCAMRKASFPPNCQELIDQIKQGRIQWRMEQSVSADNDHHICIRMANAPESDWNPEKMEAHRYVEPPDRWRRRLEAATPEDRWTIISEPLVQAQCQQREEYASKLRGGFIKLDPTVWIAAMRDVVAMIDKQMRMPKKRLA